jgi:hypothetical protein
MTLRDNLQPLYLTPSLPLSLSLSLYIYPSPSLPLSHKFMNFSSFHEKEKLMYSTVLVMTMLGVALYLCISLVKEHRMATTLDAFEKENNAPFSKELLCAWDNSLTEALDIEEYRGKYDHEFLQVGVRII